ncbi:PQQ-like beta-propeller repeat protein, partial [candidate division WOR-3 bacterium]|nr:PQQ-like beta-propeller repeat protein [candidate division WOR-3 bacterium]
MRKSLTVLVVFLVALALVGCRNKPPRTPIRPLGLDEVGTGETASYKTVTTDPNRDDIQYIYDWDNADFDTSGWFPSGDSVTMPYVWWDTGWYGVAVRAKDEKGNQSAAWSDTHLVHVVIGENRKPVVETPTGPDSGPVGQYHVFKTRALDLNNDSVTVKFFWDDNLQSVPHGPVPSGTEVTDSVRYSQRGVKRIRALAWDEAGLYSDTSTAKLFTALQTNTRPNRPAMAGPRKGVANGPNYRFYASASDPDPGDKLQYKFFCGTEEHGWTPLQVQNARATDSFRFTSLGTYQVRAIARDSMGLVSDTSLAWTFEVVDEGVILWAIEGEDYVASPALADIQKSGELRPGVIIGNLSGVLEMFDAWQGEELHSYGVGLQEPLTSSPTIGGDNTIYIGSDDGRYFAFDNTGASLRKWAYGDSVASDEMTATAALDGSMLYMGGEDQKIHKLRDDGASVTHVWEMALGEDLLSSPVILPDGNIAFFSDPDQPSDTGFVVWLNSDGAIQWRYAAFAGSMSTPAVGNDGTIYVGTDQGELLALKDG